MEFIPGPMELVIILIIVAMLFGVGRLPEVFGAVGRGLREFRQEMASPPASNSDEQQAVSKPTESKAADITSATTPTTPDHSPEA